MTEAEVDEIIGEKDPVLRNLRISVAYGRLAEEFAELVGPGDAPWTQFATWSSEDVGAAIRGERTDRYWFLRLMRRLRADYEDLARLASEAFSAGNTAIFDEVGRAFVGFHTALRQPDPSAALTRFMEDLPPGAHGDGLVDTPVRLRDAFAAYAAAREEGGRSRARSIALGNLCLAVVEQDRVQPQLEAAFGVFTKGRPARSLTRRVAARIVTELALEVTMGPVIVRPGRGLPDGPVPEDLVELDDRFLAFAVILPDEPSDSDDWTRLGDRLAFVAALMRLMQQDDRLLGSSPFTAAEREQIEAGVVPDRFVRTRGR